MDFRRDASQGLPLLELRDGEKFYFVADIDNGKPKAEAIRWKYVGRRASWDGPQHFIARDTPPSSGSHFPWSGGSMVCRCEDFSTPQKEQLTPAQNDLLNTQISSRSSTRHAV